MTQIPSGVHRYRLSHTVLSRGRGQIDVGSRKLTLQHQGSHSRDVAVQCSTYCTTSHHAHCSRTARIGRYCTSRSVSTEQSAWARIRSTDDTLMDKSRWFQSTANAKLRRHDRRSGASPPQASFSHSRASVSPSTFHTCLMHSAQPRSPYVGSSQLQ